MVGLVGLYFAEEMTKTLLLTLTYAVGIGELILAIYFWVTNSKSEIRRVATLLSLSTALWVLTSAVIAYRIDTPSALLLNRFVYVFGIFVISSFLHFTVIYPYRLFVIDKLHAILFYIPAVIFSLLSVTTSTVVQSSFLHGPNDPGQLIGGAVYPWYNIYLSLMYFLGIIILFLQRRRSDGRQKKDITLLVFTFFIGGVPAVYLDLITPFFHLANTNFLFGNIITVVWLGATTYLIRKK